MSYLSKINTSNVRYVWFWFSTEPHKNHQRKCAHYFSTNNMMMWFCLKGNSHHGNKTKQKRVKIRTECGKAKSSPRMKKKDRKEEWVEKSSNELEKSLAKNRLHSEIGRWTMRRRVQWNQIEIHTMKLFPFRISCFLLFILLSTEIAQYKDELFLLSLHRLDGM